MTDIFRAGNGMWASKISIVSPESGAVLHSVELEQNQGIHSICLTKFQSVGMIDWYLLAGTSNSMILNPRHSQGTSPKRSQNNDFRVKFGEIRYFLSIIGVGITDLLPTV